MTGAAIGKLRAGDLDQLEELLRENGLPSDDCAVQAEVFYGVYDADRLIAAAGLEPAGKYGLLRSLVVQPGYRGRGIARRLCDHLVELGKSKGYEALYLLTDSASFYFEKQGFSYADREQAPAAIRATRQFDSLCPDSASLMILPLERGSKNECILPTTPVGARVSSSS